MFRLKEAFKIFLKQRCSHSLKIYGVLNPRNEDVNVVLESDSLNSNPGLATYCT